jgi:hypothetical protein
LLFTKALFGLRPFTKQCAALPLSQKLKADKHN